MSAPEFIDGYLAPSGRIVPRSLKIRRPFRLNPIAPDIATKVYTYDYDVSPDQRFTPRIAERTSGAPDIAPDDALAYLVDEPDPEKETSARGRIQRTFANIPGPQTTPWGTGYVRPAVPGTGANRNYGSEALGNAGLFYQPDTALEQYKAYSRRAIATDQGVANTPTGGTATLTFGADTTAGQAYNVAAATLKAALDGLTSVTNYGGLASLTGNYNDAAGFLATFNNFATATLNTGSLTYTEATLQSGVTLANGGWTQQVTIQLVLAAMPRATFGGSLNVAGLTGYSAGSAGIGDTRVYDSATLAVTYVQIASLTPITAGTFDFTIFGQTAAIPYNATFAQVDTLLNALSNVAAHGGVTCESLFGTGPTILYSGGTGIYFNLRFGLPPFTAGTHTITIFGQTTGTIAHSASIATIETALNALTEVQERGNCVVSGTGLSADGTTISFTITFSAAAMVGTSLLTPTPSAVTVGLVAGTDGRQQTIKFTASQVARLLTFTNPHDMETGDAIYVKQGSTYYYAREDWTYVSANQISVDPAIAPWSTGTAITEAGKFVGDYAPGYADHNGREVTLFYLPGVTSGIATYEDIPPADQPLDDTRYLDAVVNGADYVTHSAGTVESWMGPILMRAKKEIKLPRSTDVA